jgi:hypothetical protein
MYFQSLFWLMLAPLPGFYGRALRSFVYKLYRLQFVLVSRVLRLVVEIGYNRFVLRECLLCQSVCKLTHRFYRICTFFYHFLTV